MAALLSVSAATVGALAGCGTTAPDRPNVSATLVLAGAPSAVDVGIYVAAARGYDDAEGVGLRIRPATTPATGVRRLRSGSATFAVLDIHDLAIARARGDDLVGVMAILQLPVGRASASGAARARPPGARAAARPAAGAALPGARAGDVRSHAARAACRRPRGDRGDHARLSRGAAGSRSGAGARARPRLAATRRGAEG